MKSFEETVSDTFARALVSLSDVVKLLESMVPSGEKAEEWLSIEERNVMQRMASAMATLLVFGASERDVSNRYNGIRVARGDDGKTLFIPLPRDQWAPIAGPGRCGCGHCDGQAFWDTIAVSIESNHSWTVHKPELHFPKNR